MSARRNAQRPCWRSCERSLTELVEGWNRVAREAKRDPLRAVVDGYLSIRHRDDPKKTSLTRMTPQPEVFVWIAQDRLRPGPTPSRRPDWRIWPALFCGAQPLERPGTVRVSNSIKGRRPSVTAWRTAGPLRRQFDTASVGHSPKRNAEKAQTRLGFCLRQFRHSSRALLSGLFFQKRLQLSSEVNVRLRIRSMYRVPSR